MSMREASCPPALPAIQHGGDLSAARLAYPQAPEPWLDLSTGVNPYSYPVGKLQPECYARLPCPGELRALEEAAANAYGVPGRAEVVAAPGTQAIINWLPRLFPARRAGILGFTYCEHARSWAACGARVTTTKDFVELKGHDAAIVVNPNNPDGMRIAAQDLHALAASLSKHSSILIVDEAFIDLESMASAVPNMPSSGMIVLRSFGKTYGLPGLRLGFAIAPASITARLRAALGP
ncbi:MAG: aminotransferase class I/II-fold pyridoxal phosphate-dependent enzyme, partial [Methylocapsa sp.]|nr:aminotransferase class I/II-fold pyridoxal phosphate-dependent enzyme [Methylocapsa sp.]